jgi:hypothetical protein
MACGARSVWRTALWRVEAARLFPFGRIWGTWEQHTKRGGSGEWGDVWATSTFRMSWASGLGVGFPEAVHGRKQEETGHRRKGVIWTQGDRCENLAGGIRGWAVSLSFRPRKTPHLRRGRGFLATRRGPRRGIPFTPLNRLFSSWFTPDIRGRFSWRNIRRDGVRRISCLEYRLQAGRTDSTPFLWNPKDRFDPHKCGTPNGGASGVAQQDAADLVLAAEVEAVADQGRMRPDLAVVEYP